MVAWLQRGPFSCWQCVSDAACFDGERRRKHGGLLEGGEPLSKLPDGREREEARKGGETEADDPAQVDDVRQSIADLRRTTAQLANAHSRRLATTNQRELAGLTNEVHELTTQTRELTSALRTRIVGMNERNWRASLGEEGNRVRRIHIEGLQKSFSQSLGEYSVAEKKSRDAYRSRAERQYRVGEFFFVPDVCWIAYTANSLQSSPTLHQRRLDPFFAEQTDVPRSLRRRCVRLSRAFRPLMLTSLPFHLAARPVSPV